MTKKVTLQVDANEYEFAKQFAKANGYFGAEDFLNGILTTAIMEWQDESRPEYAELKRLHTIIDQQDVKIRVLAGFLMEALRSKVRQDLEHEAGLMGKPIYSVPPVNDDDLDEEIPF